MNSPIENTYDFETILKDARQVWRTAYSGPDCPLNEALFDFVYGDLEPDEAGRMSDHIQQCEACRIKRLQMEADRTEWELMLDNNPDLALAQALGPEGIKRMEKCKQAPQTPSISMSAIKDALIRWISPPWQPNLAGAMMTAAAPVPEQNRHFTMEHGEYINISCAWKGRDRTDSAIMLAWNANIFTNSHLWARFIDPETRDILFEHCLGPKLEGEKSFTEKQLGFNPCGQKWAVAIVVEEVS